MKEKQIVLQPDVKESGVRIIPPEGFEVEKIETVDGFIAVTFKPKEPKLPRSWEDFCEMYPLKKDEYYINEDGRIYSRIEGDEREVVADKSTLPDRATAEAVLALCQLIQLRNAYNGDWVTKCNDYTQKKYVILFDENELRAVDTTSCENRLLIFKTKELRDEFLRNFRPLIEKLRPLYGIREEVE